MSGLAASHLQLEVSHERILLYGDGEYQWDEVLEAVSNLDCKAAQLDSLKLFSDLLDTCVPGIDAALLRLPSHYPKLP